MDDFDDFSEADENIVAAQDAYFEGNLNKVIAECEKALQVSPKEQSAFDLLGLALCAIDPPNYGKAHSVAVEWGARCGDKPKQLLMGIKSAYYLDNLPSAVDFATKLTKQKEGIICHLLLLLMVFRILKQCIGCCNYQ